MLSLLWLWAFGLRAGKENPQCPRKKCVTQLERYQDTIDGGLHPDLLFYDELRVPGILLSLDIFFFL